MALCLATAPALAGSEPCVSEKDERALNTRVLQTALMVAALSCNEQQRYNAFVTNYRGHSRHKERRSPKLADFIVDGESDVPGGGH